MLKTPSRQPPAAQNDDDAAVRDHRRKRLKNIIISHLKDARDVLETREALSRSWKTGGMEFQPEQVERVMKEIELARAVLDEELRLLRIEAQSNQQNNTAFEFEKTFETHMTELSEPELPPAEKGALLEPEHWGESRIEPHGTSTRSSVHSQGLVNVPQDIRRAGIVYDSTPANQNDKITNKGKSFVDSVATSQVPRFKTRVLGPIDELANMTIEDFRRLGPPAEAMKKIVEKVDLLAADSLFEQKKGIDAWKRSEVYRTYLSLGAESLEKKIPVADVIEQRKSIGDQTLTVDEFNAVAEVNQRISFSR